MNQNEQNVIEKTPEKIKTLIAGKILSLVPLISIALCIITLLIFSDMSFSTEPSSFERVFNKLCMTITTFFMFFSTVPSFICALTGLFFLLYARKKIAKKLFLFIDLCIIGMVLSLLLMIGLSFLMRGFESTIGQLEKLSKNTKIEEFVLTHDSEAGGLHDGIMYNDFDLYLADGGFLQVSHMSEYMTSFRLNAIGDWVLVYVYENSDKKFVKYYCLEQKDLLKLFGIEVKKLSKLIKNYDIFLEKVENLPIVEENPTKTGFFKEPLKKEKLALREQAVYEDILNQQGVVLVKKIKGRYEYLENYWYSIAMNDGHSFLMTVSAVLPQDDKSLKCYFSIHEFDGEPISFLSYKNTTYGIDYYSPYTSSVFAKAIGVEMQSYRDFFSHYDEFLNLTTELIIEGKKAKENPNRNKNSGMMPGVYVPQ